jgi:N-acetylneuraminic acid mutarotase
MQIIARHAGMGRTLVRRNPMCPRAGRPLISLAAAMQAIGLAGLALTLVACGGSSSSTSTTTSTNYRVGGTITGLSVSSVVLANGTDTVTVAAGASTWTFPNSFVAGSSYSVTVQTQPTGELCAVTSGASGTDTGSVGDVTVACGFGTWNWEGGLNTANGSGVYGTLGTALASNVPGARYDSSSWTDSAGNFWLFGGIGYDSTGGTGYLNDLWQYTPSTGQWIWVSGGNADNASGVYGAQGAAAAGNVPGARQAASSWTDSSGNFWLFGGVGYDSAGGVGNLNDLWQYSTTTRQWTWISGGNGNNASGVYGTQGTAAAGNVPGARQSASSWTDSAGNLWLFGGVGYSASGAAGNLSDLWRYTPSSGQWTWISGGNADNAAGVYGTQATAAASNVPGARYSATSWIDSSGNLWLFGGYGYDSIGGVGRLNDLWRFSTSSAQWTWIGGENDANAIGVYDTLGTASVSNVPGARYSASSWIDAAGNLWLFGGYGYDASGGVGNLNDLWRYDPTTLQWTWVSGGYEDNASGSYGTQGTASVTNVPGARSSVSAWIDSSGNFWLFGGVGYDSAGVLGDLNDLWQYNPSAGS